MCQQHSKPYEMCQHLFIRCALYLLLEKYFSEPKYYKYKQFYIIHIQINFIFVNNYGIFVTI